MFQEQSGEIRSVLPAVFFEKAVPKMFGKFLENYLRQRILKTHNYAEYELWRWYFPTNFPKIFRAAIFNENLPMDVLYFIKELLWISVSDMATLKIILGGSKLSSKLTFKTLEVAKKWRSVLQINILKKS